MSRIHPLKVEQATGKTADIYKALQTKMGKVLNIFQTMGQSEVALEAFLALSQAAERTLIPPKTREAIALIVAQSNGCNYCLSAHSTIAKSIGIDESDVVQARLGLSKDPKTSAILKFVKTVVEKRAQINDSDIASLKSAGISDKEIVEIILITQINLFTNYFNLITDPDIDFPKVSADSL